MVYITSSLSLAIVLSTTLTIETVCAPLLFASRSAARVSAVSPDWLITMQRSLSRTTGVSVAEFAREVAFAEYPRRALYQIFGGHSDMPCAAAGDDMNYADVFYLLVAEGELREIDFSVNYSAAERIAHGFRLLGYFFFS